MAKGNCQGHQFCKTAESHGRSWQRFKTKENAEVEKCSDMGDDIPGRIYCKSEALCDDIVLLDLIQEN